MQHMIGRYVSFAAYGAAAALVLAITRRAYGAAAVTAASVGIQLGF
jgi:hypothetical protein